MPGWVPFDADGWEETAELLTGSGKKWTRAAAIFDLRWHADQRKKIPGRPKLIRRWNQTDHWVRSLLKDEDAWRDPSKKNRQPTASRPPGRRQRIASPPPGRERLNLDSSDGSASRPPADRQGVASESPADLHTRVDPPSPSPNTLTDPPPNPPPGGSPVEALADWLREQSPDTDPTTWMADTVWKAIRTTAPAHTQPRRKSIVVDAIRLIIERESGRDYSGDGFQSHDDTSQPTRTPRPSPTPEAQQVWTEVLDAMQARIGYQDADIWLRKPCVPDQVEGGVLRLWAENAYYVDWIVDNYASDIREITDLRLEFAVGAE